MVTTKRAISLALISFSICILGCTKQPEIQYIEKPIYVYRTDETLEDAKFSIMDIKLNAWRIPINLYLFDHEIQNIKIFRKYETIPSMKVGDAVVVFFNNKISKKIFKSFEQKIIYNKKVALITLKTIYEIAALRYMKDILQN